MAISYPLHRPWSFGASDEILNHDFRRGNKISGDHLAENGCRYDQTPRCRIINTAVPVATCNDYVEFGIQALA